MKPQIKFKLLGRVWKIRLYFSQKKFEKKHGNAEAVTWSNRLIEISPIGMTLETLRHELVHAYQKEMCLGSTNEMSPEDMEEWMAELVGRRLEELLDLSNTLYARIREEIEKQNNAASSN